MAVKAFEVQPQLGATVEFLPQLLYLSPGAGISGTALMLGEFPQYSGSTKSLKGHKTVVARLLAHIP